MADNVQLRDKGGEIMARVILCQDCANDAKQIDNQPLPPWEPPHRIKMFPGTTSIGCFCDICNKRIKSGEPCELRNENIFS